MQIKQGAFKEKDLIVIVSKDAGRWHLSVSHPLRYPNWDEIKHVRYKYLPNDITAAMLLPPKEDYVNLHPTCFHLWEIDASLGGISV